MSDFFLSHSIVQTTVFGLIIHSHTGFTSACYAMDIAHSEVCVITNQPQIFE